MKCEDEKLRHWFSEGKCSTVRETSWQVPFLAPAAEGVTEAALQGVNMVTHAEVPGCGMNTHGRSLRDPTLAAAHSPQLRKTLWISESWSKGKTKEPKLPEHKDGECTVLLPLHFRNSVWGCASWQTEQNPCAMVTDKWFRIQDTDWFSHSWHVISLPFCSSPAQQHTLSVEKKSRCFSHFSVWIKKYLPWNDRWNTPE